MTDVADKRSFPFKTPKGARKPKPPDAPAHYRLSAETWATVLKEYREGATATDLASKWRVSIHAIRKQITETKSTKREWGDAQVREQAAEREAEIEEARRNSPEAVAERLFDGVVLGDDQADSPACLAQVATYVSGRAMMRRLWGESRALAGLAESYARLADKAGGGGGGSIETMRLDMLLEIVMDPDDRVAKRFERRSEGRSDPDAAVKNFYWSWREKTHNAIRHNMHELMMRAASAERLARSLGGEPKINRTDVEIEAWVREWLSGPPSEANVKTRTEMGAWPWR